MTQSPNLKLPYIAPAQAQKHVTHNEALRILDSLVQLAVQERDRATPSPDPAEGERYIVAEEPIGAWSGHADEIATWQDGAWSFSAPGIGWIAYVIEEGTLALWNGSVWGDLSEALATLQNLALLGLGTTADAANPFSAKLNKALWTARYGGEGGDGDLRYTLNKESESGVLSLLMQSDWAARAEIGLISDDDLAIKVSPDGSSWIEAARFDRATGRVSFPAMGGPRELLTADRTYYVRPDGSDANDGLSNTAGGAFASIQKAVDVVSGTLDLAGHKIAIQVADGAYTESVQLKNVVGFGAPGDLVIRGNAGSPSAVTVTSLSSNHAMRAEFIASVWDILDMQLVGGSDCIFVRGASVVVRFGNLDFGAATYHLRASDGACLLCLSSYTISDNASHHFVAAACATIRLEGVTVTLSGTNAFAAFARIIRASVLIAVSVTFVGSATGSRYQLLSNGVIDTNGAGASYLPGNAAGTAVTGGQYA
jgi:hypothetical protein